MFEFLTRLFRHRPPQKLEYLQTMDKLASEIARVAEQIRVSRKANRKNEQGYWEDKWEELVLMHMEFEWGLHPENKQRIWSN